MREIKFRGKSRLCFEALDEMGIPHENGWVIGNLLENYIVGGIVEATNEYLNHEWWVGYHPDSLGQYTGLKDKNGKEIYEGDIVHIWENTCTPEKILDFTDQIIYQDGQFDFANNRGFALPIITFDEIKCEVIGNICDNPELVEVEA